MERKIFRIISDTITLSFGLTLLMFAYRYMWFATETVPDGRVAVAMTGVFVFGLISHELRKPKDRSY